MQTALRRVIKGIGGFDHAEWRAFRSERTKADARGFIDGDLIEQVGL
jgi:DNA damage-binding protein 1